MHFYHCIRSVVVRTRVNQHSKCFSKCFTDAFLSLHPVRRRSDTRYVVTRTKTAEEKPTRIAGKTTWQSGNHHLGTVTVTQQILGVSDLTKLLLGDVSTPVTMMQHSSHQSVAQYCNWDLEGHRDIFYSWVTLLEVFTFKRGVVTKPVT